MKNIFSFFYKGKRIDSEKKAEQNAEGILAYELAKRALKKKLTESEKIELLELLDIAIENGIKEAYLERGFCLHQLGYDTDAIKDFDAVENLFPTNPDLYFARGLSKRILLDYDSALLDFEKALIAAKQSELFTDKDLVRFELELQSTKDRKKHMDNPNLREALLKRKGEPKRRQS